MQQQLQRHEHSLAHLSEHVKNIDTRLALVENHLVGLDTSISDLNVLVRHLTDTVTKLLTNGEQLTKDGVRQCMDRVSQVQEQATTEFIKKQLTQHMITVRTVNIPINNWPTRMSSNSHKPNLTNLDGVFLLTLADAEANAFLDSKLSITLRQV